jgi:hypothetical protein
MGMPVICSGKTLKMMQAKGRSSSHGAKAPFFPIFTLFGQVFYCFFPDVRNCFGGPIVFLLFLGKFIAVCENRDNFASEKENKT